MSHPGRGSTSEGTSCWCCALTTLLRLVLLLAFSESASRAFGAGALFLNPLKDPAPKFTCKLKIRLLTSALLVMGPPPCEAAEQKKCKDYKVCFTVIKRPIVHAFLVSQALQQQPKQLTRACRGRMPGSLHSQRIYVLLIFTCKKHDMRQFGCNEIHLSCCQAGVVKPAAGKASCAKHGLQGAHIHDRY